MWIQKVLTLKGTKYWLEQDRFSEVKVTAPMSKVKSTKLSTVHSSRYSIHVVTMRNYKILTPTECKYWPRPVSKVQITAPKSNVKFTNLCAAHRYRPWKVTVWKSKVLAPTDSEYWPKHDLGRGTDRWCK